MTPRKPLHNWFCLAVAVAVLGLAVFGVWYCCAKPMVGEASEDCVGLALTMRQFYKSNDGRYRIDMLFSNTTERTCWFDGNELQAFTARVRDGQWHDWFCGTDVIGPDAEKNRRCVAPGEDCELQWPLPTDCLHHPWCIEVGSYHNMTHDIYDYDGPIFKTATYTPCCLKDERYTFLTHKHKGKCFFG